MSDLSRALDEYSVCYAMREDLPTEGQIWGRDGQKSPKAEMLVLKADTAIKKKKKKKTVGSPETFLIYHLPLWGAHCLRDLNYALQVDEPRLTSHITSNYIYFSTSVKSSKKPDIASPELMLFLQGSHSCWGALSS